MPTETASQRTPSQPASQPGTASQPHAGGTAPTRLRELREAAGHSRATLAALAGVGTTAIYQAEMGTASPRLATMEALAHALGRSVAEVWPSTTAGPDGYASHAPLQETVSPADDAGE